MRTLLLVVVMLLVAVAAGLSFVLQAAANGQPAAEFEFGCDGGGVLASRELVLITCTATARNTGSVTLSGAQLEFLPATNLPPPDFYLFWSETHDGLRSVPGEVQLAYDFGGIAPGASSVIVLEVIVRSTHDYGADVALVAQPDQHEYGRSSIHGTVVPEGGAVVPVTLARDFDVTVPVSSATYRLAIMNFGDTPYDDVTAELSPGSDVILKSDEWTRATSPGRLTADFGALAGSAEIDRVLTMVPEAGSCTTVHPVLIVTAVQAGLTRRQPVVDDGVLLGACGVSDGALAGALPNAGSGPMRAGRNALPLALALSLGGAKLLALGFSLRHRNPPMV